MPETSTQETENMPENVENVEQDQTPTKAPAEPETDQQEAGEDTFPR